MVILLVDTENNIFKKKAPLLFDKMLGCSVLCRFGCELDKPVELQLFFCFCTCYF